MYSFTQGHNYLFARSKKFILLLAATMLIGGMADKIIAAETAPEKEQAAIEKKSSNPFAEQWGIEITALRLTAHGHMIDFRYKVLDAKKAGPLFVRQIKPYLVHQESGKVLAVPNTAKIGTLRNSNIPKENRIYWMFFGNKGLVQKGDKVSIVIGDFKAESLVVL